MEWLSEPPEGTKICLGFDGSETGDWTCIKGETLDGFLFTPRFASAPTIWNPADYGGRIPRDEVDAAVDDLFRRFKVVRMYCDPPLWQSEIEMWCVRHNKEVNVVGEWPTYSATRMHPALERFVTDLSTGRLKHDGCPITTAHVKNARMGHRRDGRYVLMKPNVERKIDAAVTSAICHEAACDARAKLLGEESLPAITFGL